MCVSNCRVKVKKFGYDDGHQEQEEEINSAREISPEEKLLAEQ